MLSRYCVAVGALAPYQQPAKAETRRMDMANTELYEHFLNSIQAFKQTQGRTEEQTEMYVETMCNKIDKYYVNGELTDHQYQALYLELPK